MLRIKQCFQACGVSQSALVKASGWSKGLVSRVFLTGELPKEPESRSKFIADLGAFVDETPELLAWLQDKNLTVLNLLDEMDGVDAGDRCGRKVMEQQGDLEAGIVALAGRVALNASIDERQVFALCRTGLYLLERLRGCSLGMDELGEIEVTAGRMLLGAEA